MHVKKCCRVLQEKYLRIRISIIEIKLYGNYYKGQREIESRYEDLSGNRGEIVFKKNRWVYCLELQRGQVVIRINNKRRL